MKYDVLILGGGPAGLSASIYTARGGLLTLVVSHGKTPLLWAGSIDNYLGFSNGITGKELYARSVEQAKNFGVEFAFDEIISIDKTDPEIVLSGVSGDYTGSVLLLATGNPPAKTTIKNAEQFDGKGIAYCVTCDGFFYKDKKAGVLGYKDYAIKEAMELKNFTSDITVYTNGRELVLSEKFKSHAEDFRFEKRKISSFEGNDFLERIEFTDGDTEDIDGMFVAFGSASSVDFAKKTGIITNGDYIVVDPDQKTNIEGIFAAGSCTSNCRNVNQIATSVGQGALAGKKMLDYLGKSSADYYNMRST